MRRGLRPIEKNIVETYIGTVERLEGEMYPDGRRSGNVVLAILPSGEGETIRARTILNADDYSLADRAHMTSGAYVRITGRLRPGRQPRQITEMTQFEVLHRPETEQMQIPISP